MKLYAYCVTGTETQPSSGTIGLFNRQVYSITAGPISALVSDVAEESVVISKQTVLTHQNVIGSVLNRTTPLPFRFGTVVDQRALTSYLVSRQQALAEKLKFVDGCVEMSVKIIWRESASDVSTDNRNESSWTNSVGTEFLRKKSVQIAGSKQLMDKANDIATWLKSCVGPTTADMRLTVRPSQRLVLAADCLVRRLELDSYHSAIESARADRPDLHFLTSGPWAPYSFVNIDLEFNSQFGVS
ncbi:MAG TPA: GvpL/GvpF family gas vesicle protein [Pyrinomonadaceae bacterium]|nr:GvpL/GvpF family gas vesicle protein [Pyrinomonadaceae bacterium]